MDSIGASVKALKLVFLELLVEIFVEVFVAVLCKT
jgi:hypothetical protein